MDRSSRVNLIRFSVRYSGLNQGVTPWKYTYTMEENMNQIGYPHDPKIVNVSVFSESLGKGVAGVVLTYGPVVIRAKLFQGENGLFLSLPSRKSESNNNWYQHAYFQDKTLLEVFEKMAIKSYEETLEKQMLTRELQTLSA